MDAVVVVDEMDGTVDARPTISDPHRTVPISRGMCMIPMNPRMQISGASTVNMEARPLRNDRLASETMRNTMPMARARLWIWLLMRSL
jgi:hypothetical protein